MKGPFFRFGKKKPNFEKATEKLNTPLGEERLSEDMEENIARFKEYFKDDDTILFRRFQSREDPSIEYCIIYCDGMVDNARLNEDILRPLMQVKSLPPGNQGVEFLMSQAIFVNGCEKEDKVKDIIPEVASGVTLLLLPWASEGIMLSAKAFEVRGIIEPDSEKVLSGPREGFNEALLINLSLVRRRLRTNDLKMQFSTLGEVTHTRICLAYLDSVVNRSILRELHKRLATIELDAILDSNYITELIRDNPLSPFRTVGYSERPDVIAAKILEGRIAIFVDGSPAVLTVPYLFIENFQSNEDYYLNFYYTSFSRLLRIMGFFMTVLIPALYIAITTHHHETLPAPLMISVAVERQGVPLPASIEALILLITFDILRETGLRMPSNVGQALSILGALVVGQAAVAANLVAAPMIIIVAITGITALLIPKMNSPVIFARLMLLFLSSTFGFWGIIVGSAALLCHILNLKSFGMPQLMPDKPLHLQEFKDLMIRAPWWHMRLRPAFMASNRLRMRGKGGAKQ